MKDMKKCPYCGAKIDDGMNFCVYCMTSLDKKTAVVQKRKTFRLTVAVTVVAVTALIAGAIIFAVSKLSNPAPHGAPEPVSDLTDSQTEGVTALYTETGEITSAKAETRAETDAISSPDETEPKTDAPADTEAANITEYVLQTTEEIMTVKATERVTEAKETVPETEPPQTEEATTAHVHTDACLKWIVDVPYQAAVYKTEKIIDTPYSPAVYGDIPYEVNDCHYRVILYIKNSDLPSFTADHVILLDSTEEFLRWKEEVGAEDVEEDTFGKISDENFRYKYLTYDPYTTVKYEYGLISPEQPEVSHTEAVLVSPEQEEQGHYEYVCGYQP